jgi:Fe2+ transport system protein B
MSRPRRANCGPHHGPRGLQGKSFIPLLSAYACAVPAIMATRTIESKREHCNYPDCPVHDVLGASAGIYLDHRGLHSQPASGRFSAQFARRLAGTLGRAIEPIIKPLGFDWKIGIGLITSLAARETIIATLGPISGMDCESNQTGLQQALQHDLSPGGAVAPLIFFAFAMQCISTIAVVRRETSGWKWPVLQFTYMGVLAYAGAFLANHLIG